MIDFLIRIDLFNDNSSLQNLFIESPIFKIVIDNEDFKLLAWGDPILSEDFENRLKANPNIEFIVNNIYGHFYFIYKNIATNELYVGNSIFSILPIYFNQEINTLTCSNNPISIKRPNQESINKRFFLENILFTYPLFNESIIKGIQLLPSNQYLKVKNQNVFNCTHTYIEDLFIMDPKPWRKSIMDISDLFIQASQKYFPNSPFITSLTAGFDGRTLVSTGLYLNRVFSTYCFGNKDSDDIKFARKLSNLSKTNFISIDLDEDYALNESLKNGLDFIKNSSGCGGFPRAHYLFASKKLSAQSKYLITGNFGSEIFRSVNKASAVISPNLYEIFNAKNFEKAILSIENSIEWTWLNKSAFESEWQSLKEDIIKLPCFDPEFKRLTKNQRFYKFVFEEVFRKYFGAEMVNQFQFISNRTPFIDIDFLRGIMGTSLPGAYSDFFTDNPLKRFRGQVLYANIINKTYQQFAKEGTDKGYSPEDLLTVGGNLTITFSYLRKKLIRSRRLMEDPYSVNLSFYSNLDFWNNMEIHDEIFSRNFFNNVSKANQDDRHSYFIALSQAWLYDHLLSNSK